MNGNEKQKRAIYARCMDTDDLDMLVLARALTRSGRARTLREDAGLSLADVASGVGASRVTIHRWEHGTHAPRAEAAVKYGRLLAHLARSQALA